MQPIRTASHLLFPAVCLIAMASLTATAASAQMPEWSQLQFDIIKLCQQQQFDDAMTMAERALQSAEKEPKGPGGLPEALTRGVLAELYRERKQSAEADRFLARTFEIFDDMGRGNPSMFIMGMTPLIAKLKSDGQYLLVLVFARYELFVLEKDVDENDLILVNTINKLAELCVRSGLRTSAHRMYKRSYEIQKQAPQRDESKFAQTMAFWGEHYQKCGRQDSAEKLLRKAYKQAKEHAGADYKTIGMTLGLLAQFYEDTGQKAKHKKAQELMKEFAKNLSKYQEVEKIENAHKSLNVIKMALERAMQMEPEPVKDLQSLKGRYTMRIPKDPWDNEAYYRPEAGVIGYPGPDGKPDTEDDITETVDIQAGD